MTQTSSVDSLILKENLLEMWVPVIGAQTVPEFCKLNWEKIAAYMFKKDIIPFMMDKIEGSYEKFCKRYVFKTNFENYFDAQPPFQLGEAILSGSFSEGLFLYSSEPPDMDFMCVLNNITFSQGDQEDGNLQLRDDTPFVYAFVTNNETQHLWACFFDEADKQAGKYRLSSKKLKEKLRENYQKTGRIFRSYCNENIDEVSEGAAVTIRKLKPSISFFQSFSEIAKEILRQPITERCKINKKLFKQMRVDTLYKIIPSSDIVLSIYCEGWPSCAREWITRERLWPDVSLVEKITQAGFHIIPKSSANGDFRLSFSGAETMLIKILAPLQHKVMRAFKAVVKYSQNTWNTNLKEIILSYHLKTISFWHFEKTSQESWTEDTLVHHLVTLLEELAEALRIQSLPMYFMPKVNLFQDVDDPEATMDLMEKISQLSRNYSAMSEAVNNKNTLKGIVFTHSEHDSLANMFHSIREENLRKTDEGGECLFTWYDWLVAICSPDICKAPFIRFISQ